MMGTQAIVGWDHQCHNPRELCCGTAGGLGRPGSDTLWRGRMGVLNTPSAWDKGAFILAELTMGCYLSIGLPEWGTPWRGCPPYQTLSHTLPAPCQAAPDHCSYPASVTASGFQGGAVTSGFQNRIRCFGPFGVFLAGTYEHGDEGHKPQLLLPSHHFHTP